MVFLERYYSLLLLNYNFKNSHFTNISMAVGSRLEEQWALGEIKINIANYDANFDFVIT